MSDGATLDALILDFGGVLILGNNSPERQRWLDRIGLENDAFDGWMWRQPEVPGAMRGELTEAEFWTAIGTRVGLSVEDSLAMAVDYWAGDVPNAGVVALARRARASGLRMGLLSNAYLDLSPYLAQHGVRELFDECIISALVGTIKPEPAIYELACSRLRVQPQRALFLDDKLANVEGARAFGLHALQYVGPDTLAEASEVLGLPPEP